ncbi:CU044_5270 family protein [Actinomadura sp. 9N407]|uniref:CU044_5270 family protein n=1 Tax=Actinomadura sp. 9N407 TaxID=3375154 RepID=UPI0037877675
MDEPRMADAPRMPDETRMLDDARMVDDLRVVREAYGEPAPPTLREMSEARARAFGEPPRRRVRFGWRLKAGIGVVAVGAAAAIAIAAIGSGSPGSPSSPAPVALGKQAVLAAAEKAAAQPLGKYWFTDRIQGQAYVIRAKTGTYAITAALDESFNWHGAKSGAGEAYYGRDLPAHPQTERDEALWRKAGSPSSFRVRGDGRDVIYTTRATDWRSDGPEVGIDPGGGGAFMGRSVEELQNLPTDPAALTEMFLGAGKGSPSGLSKRLGFKPGDAGPKIMRVSSLLGGAPVPPKVRAGLMRALAAQQGIHAIGKVTDPLGREGVALAADDRTVTVTAEHGAPKAEQGTYRTREVIIFDERTGALLSRQNVLTVPGGRYAEMKPGFIIEYTAVRSAQWTDTRPKPPAKLPF